MLIDLTAVINEDTTLYLGTPKAEIREIATVERDGYNEKQLLITTHTGTHIDLPAHFLVEGCHTENASLASCMGEGIRADAVLEGDCITDLAVKGEIRDRALIIHCDYPVIKRDGYYEHWAYLSEELIQRLVEARPKLIGVTQPSVDPPEGNFIGHRSFLGANIPIVENLVNTALLPEAFFFMALPLKIKSGDASPVRAVAIIKE